MSTKMLPVPTAAATRLATIGMIDWPMRLAMVRSEFAVPIAPPLAMVSTPATPCAQRIRRTDRAAAGDESTPAMLAVIEMLSANPATAMAAYKSGSGNGKAKSV